MQQSVNGTSQQNEYKCQRIGQKSETLLFVRIAVFALYNYSYLF